LIAAKPDADHSNLHNHGATEWIAASGSENNWLDTCEAHHVGISPEEDRGGAAGTVGEGE
jgi:hypothetical protein